MTSNRERYNELCQQYKVEFVSSKNDPILGECDVALENAGVGYAHRLYRVVKNEPNLKDFELALIADKGNLCFGYERRGDCICVYTD